MPTPNNFLENQLRAVMAKRELTQAKMARELGIAPESMGKYLADSSVKGKRNPERLATKLSAMGISLDWYFTGRGPMLLDEIKYQGIDEELAESVLLAEARKIQYLIDRGLVRCNCEGKGNLDSLA